MPFPGQNEYIAVGQGLNIVMVLIAVVKKFGIPEQVSIPGIVGYSSAYSAITHRWIHNPVRIKKCTVLEEVGHTGRTPFMGPGMDNILIIINEPGVVLIFFRVIAVG